MGTEHFDKIILGAGLYGLYAAKRCAKKGERVLVLEYDAHPFARATYINQARVHNGYHYPRSLSTALKSAGYYRRFHEDFSFSINDRFAQIYATGSQFSWTNAEQFASFCEAAGIRCEQVPVSKYFLEGACDGAFLTEEDTYDAAILKDYYLDALRGLTTCETIYGVRISSLEKQDGSFLVSYTVNGTPCTAKARFLLNATYASVNQILSLAALPPFAIKYELCEIILVKPSDALKDIGLTVMDGPFFSVMPFGKTGYHSLTSVTFTPHTTCYETLPVFSCQQGTDCTPAQFANCNDCKNRPETAWDYMKHLSDKYVRPEYAYTYEQSLFSIKPILKSSEVDDSRPTAIRIDKTENGPVLVSVLSGKINTVYDLDEVLDEA